MSDAIEKARRQDAKRLGEIMAQGELIAALYRAHPNGAEVLTELEQRIETRIAPGSQYDIVPDSWHEAIRTQLAFVRTRIAEE